MTPGDVVKTLASGKPLAPHVYEMVLVGLSARQRFAAWESKHFGAVKTITAQVDEGESEHWYDPASWYLPRPPTQEYVRFRVTTPVAWITPTKGIGVPTPVAGGMPSSSYVKKQLGEATTSWWSRVQQEAGKLEHAVVSGGETALLLVLAVIVFGKEL